LQKIKNKTIYRPNRIESNRINQESELIRSD
jgi:hypothetical protein